jgi:hypothetical protein
MSTESFPPDHHDTSSSVLVGTTTASARRTINFVDTRRINIVETKISYSNVIPYARTDGEGKLVHV